MELSQLLGLLFKTRKVKPSKKEVARDNLVGHIVGGMIVGMLMLSNNNNFTRATEIRLRDKILKETTSFQQKLTKEQLEAVAKIAYETIIESDGGERFKVNPYTFIETIAFDFEKELKSFYGDNIMDVICRFTAKNDLPVEDSYKYAENAKKVFRKKLFDTLKEIL